MSMFAFGGPVLLRCIRATNLVSYTVLKEIITKSVVSELVSTVRAESVNIDVEFVFNEIVELLKFSKYFVFRL